MGCGFFFCLFCGGLKLQVVLTGGGIGYGYFCSGFFYYFNIIFKLSSFLYKVVKI